MSGGRLSHRLAHPPSNDDRRFAQHGILRLGLRQANEIGAEKLRCEISADSTHCHMMDRKDMHTNCRG
jgi:hypothetical protein